MLRRLLFLLPVLAASAYAQSPAGDWQGAIEIGQPEPLQLILRITEAGDSLAATLDVPAQGATGLPASSASATDDSLVVELAAFGIRFDLAIAPDSLSGTFTQGPNALPIVMTSAEPLRRPQTPTGPFPYATEEVTVESEPGVTLAGTFVLPEGDGPFPTVVFLSGSGPQDRDEEIAGHRPFAVLADALAREGIASLRADDRGVGRSTGDFGASTVDTHLADARALVAAVRQRGDVASVGVLGHSEGGLTALRVADDVDFLVTLAGPTRAFQEIYPVQLQRAVELAGIDSSAAALYRGAVEAALRPIAEAPDASDEVLAPLVDSAFNEALIDVPTAARMQMGLSGPAYPQVRASFVRSLVSPGLRSLLTYDPAAALESLDVPLLALYGGKDFQVPAEMNADVLDGRDGVTVTIVADANHLFQTAETGALTEYGQIEETIAPETLQMIVAWIAETAD